MTTVTGIIPAFNQLKFIEESIESLLCQVDELIVVDDASTDGTWELLQKYKKNKNVILTRNSINSGISKGVSEGLQISRGEIILIQGGDDVSTLNRREHQENILNNFPECVLISGKPQIIDGKGEEYKNSYARDSFNNILGKSNYLKNLFLEGNSICAPSVAVRKNAINSVNNFDNNFDHVQDYITWLRLSLVGDFYFDEIPVVKYRIHGENISREIENESHYLNKARVLEFGVAINLFINSLTIAETKLLFERLSMVYQGELSLEINKIQLKRIFPNKALQVFAIEDSYFLSSSCSEYEYKILRDLIKQIPAEVQIT